VNLAGSEKSPGKISQKDKGKKYRKPVVCKRSSTRPALGTISTERGRGGGQRRQIGEKKTRNVLEKMVRGLKQNLSTTYRPIR